MSVNHSLKHVLQSSLVAVFLALPIAGWAGPVSDRPLFVDAAVDHNLMFVVDDSGSMDWEVIAPKVGNVSAVTEGYLFEPGMYTSKYYDGRILLNRTRYSLSDRKSYYLYSTDYNLQYYDPMADYNPWPSTSTKTFANSSISSAELDPGLTNTLSFNLIQKGALGTGSEDIPAAFFVKSTTAKVYERSGGEYKACSKSWDGIASDGRCYKQEWGGWKNGWVTTYASSPQPIIPITDTHVFSCDKPDQSKFKDWAKGDKTYVFKDAAGVEIAERKMGLAPDGVCLQRLELVDVDTNKNEIYTALDGKDSKDSNGDPYSEDDFFALQQQNFANWFSYYRRRHQVIRGAIAESVQGMDNMILGVFWLHNRRSMSSAMYSAADSTGLNSFLTDNYSRFGSGNWTGGGTPNRKALEHAGRQYASTSVRGTLECRKNFTLLFTDGFANDHPSSTYAGNADKDAPAPFGDTNSDTLSDIAYYYYQGLRSGSGKISGGAVRTPSECGTGLQEPWMDCNTDYHMNTYTIALGMEGQKYAGKTHFKVKDAHDNPPTWSSLSLNKTGTEQIDDLYHAAVNGRGEYYDAQSTTELVKALKAAMKDVQAQLGSGSNVSFNTNSLKDGGYIYSAQFTSQSWTGNLFADAIDKDGVVSSRKWDAASKLNDPAFDVSKRLLLTNNGGGVEFDWDNLSAEQKNDLKAGGTEALGKARMAYVRDPLIKSGEGVIFLERTSRLGAIVNSSPVYVGEPNRIWPDKAMFGAKPYSAFKMAQKPRTKAVYVGSNDGMLHGFDAETGKEVLGYIPGFLYSEDSGKGLSALTDPNLDYQSYVDLPLNTTDVYVNDEWRSIVIGGSRGANPGIFALDVTDPDEFSVANAADTVMWEFSGDNNLGHLTEAVQIALLKWADGDYRWSAVFSNGYGAPSGKNGLFIVDIDTPTNYEFIELAAGSGLSPVRMADYKDAAGALNSDGVADRAYAGDLEGRLWAIDLSGGQASWNLSNNSNVLFVAKDSGGNAQPITAQPDIARNTYKSDLSDPNLLVFVGTGKYLTGSDIPTNVANSQVQSFYGISDRGTTVNSNSQQLSRSDLSQRKITTGTVTVTTKDADGNNINTNRPVRKTDGAPLDWATDFGWYMDFPKGEQVVEGATVRGEYVIFPSNIPSVGDPCGGGGSSYLTALQLDGSTDSSKAIIDVNSDGKLDSTDEGWAGLFYGNGIINSIALIDNILIASDSGANKTPFLTNFGAGQNQTKRIGWHEIIPQ